MAQIKFDDNMSRQNDRYFKEYWSKTPIEELNENIMKGHEAKYSKPHTEYEYNMKDILDSYKESKEQY